MAKMTFHREIPVRHEVDVFVAGGGPAGAAASAAAARQGRKVFLAENENCLGGMGTAGLVPAFMCFGDRVNFLAAGIGEEILNRLVAARGTVASYRPENAHGSVAIRPEVLKRVYDQLLADAGVEFALHTRLIEVEAQDGRVDAAVLAGKSGVFAVKAKVYIDCTGDGDLAAWAGAPFEMGDDGKVMAGTLCSLWANVDFEAFRQSGLERQDSKLGDAFKDKIFTTEDRHLPGMWDLGEGIGGGNIGHTFGVDGTDERSLTRALIRGRRSLLEYERYYREYLPGFEKVVLVATGSLLGIRETRRIIGDYVLCLEDFKNRGVFDDEVGRYCYPVDIHASSPDKEEFEKLVRDFKTLRYAPGESYGIPYRCLVPKNLTNVLVAGRCVSSDRYIQSSIRVMPGCYITGQAAGVAAAVAIDGNTGTRHIDVHELQARLVKIGACLPNA